ncbi:MAG TPA: glycosyltransferase [Acetobacteraceae bacterium]|nr:glycosyltransferase [Acetobacteraceae bacterium]
MVRYDAISLAARDTVRALAGDPRFEVRHFGHVCDFPEVVHRSCDDVSDLLLDPAYQAADAAIFHFGIEHSLFNALLAGGPPVRIVCFHNVTPARFVGAGDVPVIVRSLRQIEILRHADEIWAVSATNAQELLARGFNPTRIRIIPLVVEDPARAELVNKQFEPVQVLYLGRVAPSKGLHDLIAAVSQTKLPRGAVRVTIAGNMAWSDPGYLSRLRGLIAQYDLTEVVHFAGMIDDAERERLLHAAHVLAIPSYHEGFCRPVAEGLRAGCVPLVYDAYNLPHIAAGLGRVVPTGDIGAFAAAMADLVRTLPAAIEHSTEPLLLLDRGPTSVTAFSDLAQRHTANFAFKTVGDQMRDRLLQLTTWSRCSPNS